MGLNDDRLTPGERDDLRGRLLAGSRRITPVGAHRRAIMASTLSVVLVAGLAVGAVTAANVLRAGENAGPASTPTPTLAPTEPPMPAPSETPTSTPPATPSPADAAGVVAFGDDCRSVFSEEDIASVTGMSIQLADFRWKSGEVTLLGGIDCLWASTEEYMAVTVQLVMYPEEVVPASVRENVSNACSESGAYPVCSVTGVSEDGAWYQLSVRRAQGATLDQAQSLELVLLTRSRDFDSPRPEPKTFRWWALPRCEEVVDAIDPASVGFERREPEQPAPEHPLSPSDIPVLAGATSHCSLAFSRGEGESKEWLSTRAVFVPGAGRMFDQIASAAHARALDIADAEGAVLVPGNYRLEGSPDIVAVTDGTNLLMLDAGLAVADGEVVADLDAFSAIAASLLAQLNG